MKKLLPPFVLSLLVAACGGSPPPAPAAPAQPAPVVSKDTGVDTSAVPEPTNLVVTARLSKPSQVEKVVGGWTSLPMPGADDVAGIFTDLDVGSIVDLDAPVDVAVVVEGHGTHLKPAYAVAVGVKPGASVASSPRIKSTAMGGGIFKLEMRRKHEDTGNGDHDEDADDEDDGSKICEIIPAAGPSANRLVCGSSEGSLAEIGPYLARTAPRASYPADLHVEAKLDPLRSTLEQARQLIPMLVGGVISDKVKTQAVRDLVDAALGDVVDASLDLDRLKLDVSLTDMNGTATLTSSFRDTKSLIARLAVAHPERADVPPPTFWHLPADSKEAFFGRGIDAKDLDHPRELIVDALSKGLDDQGVTPQDRQAIADLLQQYMSFFTSPSVFANGVVDAAAPTPAPAAKKDDKTKTDRPDREARLEEASKGTWALGGIEQPFAKVGAFAKSIPTTFHRPGVAKLLKNVMPDGVPSPTITTAPVNAKLGLPKDTVHLVVSVTMKADDSMSDAEAMQTLGAPAATTKGGKPAKPAAPAKPKVKLEKPYVLHWFFVPDAGRSWIGYGADENIVASHIKVALSTSTDPGVLQSRTGLEDLKTAKIGSGGFLTLRGALSPSPLSPIFKNQDRDMARMFTRLQNAPQKGATPILLTVRSLAPSGQGNAGSLEIMMKLSRDSVKDLMAAAMGH